MAQPLGSRRQFRLAAGPTRFAPAPRRKCGPDGSASPSIQDLLDRYVALWEQADIPGFVALLREDAWFTMPPRPIWFQGRAAIATMLTTFIFTPGRQRRLLPTSANGCPAFGLPTEAGAQVLELIGLVVLSVEGEQIASLVAFLDLEGLSSFALPPTLPSSLGIDAYICPKHKLTHNLGSLR